MQLLGNVLTPDFDSALVLPGRRKVVSELHPQPRFSVLPNALVRRIAIAGLIADFPLMTLSRACRVMPRILAPSEIDNPKGSRQALRILRPGCGGFFTVVRVFSFSLVEIHQFNIKGIFSLKSESNAPVCPHGHRPETAQLALERMQAIAGKVKGLRHRPD